jgi:uncharacterized protein (TIGR02996 family)
VAREEELLAAIAAAPDDDEPRMVYADWLTDRGDARGELVSLQVRLARADANDEPLDQHERVANRAHGIATMHKKAWTAPLRAIADAYYEMRRGLFEHAAKLPANFFGAIDRVHAIAPLLRSITVKDPLVQPFLASAASRRFAELRFETPRIDEELPARLADAVGALRSIHFEAPYFESQRAMRAFARWRVPVEHFGLLLQNPSRRVPRVEDDFLAQLFENIGNVRSLHLANVRCTGEIGVYPFAELESLEIIASTLCWQNLPELFARMPKLVSLHIAYCRISPDDIAALFRACPRLRRLTMRENTYMHEIIPALVPHLPRLRRLDLSNNTIDGREVTQLANADLSALRSLVMPVRLPSWHQEVVKARFPRVVFR